MIRQGVVGSVRMARVTIVGLLMLTVSCAVLQRVAALTRVEFALNSVRDGRVAGVDIGQIRGYQDLSVGAVARIALAASRGTLPFEFTVPVAAYNPAGNGVAASLVRFGWTLDLDGREALRGSFDSVVTIPAGQTVEIPLTMQLDLVKFVGGSAESLARLALNVAGANADPTTVRLSATPVVDTPIGPISYPEPITIVHRSIGGSAP